MDIYYEEENMSGPTITAECEQVKACISINRPIKWENVYNGYPKKQTALYDMDLPPEFVFFDKEKGILFDNVPNRDTFQNACATRVSIALIKAGMELEGRYQIQKGDLKDKYFIVSAEKLQKYLYKSWGRAEVKIEKKDIEGIVNKDYGARKNFNAIREKINCDCKSRNGIYIILGGFGGDITGHATLWIGNHNKVQYNDTIRDFDGHFTDYGGNIDKGGVIYFWELK